MRLVQSTQSWRLKPQALGALPGWQVQVGQRRAPQDDQGRFSLPTNWPSDTRAVAVRLSHPERGTHVYVRRPAPSARAGRSP